jgi:hypothetical protein
MIKLNNNIIINEAHIVTAEFENDSKTLKLVFSVPVPFAQVESNSNEVKFEGDEAENLWHFLLKDAQKVPSLQSSEGTTSGNQYLAGGTLPQFKPL